MNSSCSPTFPEPPDPAPWWPKVGRGALLLLLVAGTMGCNSAKSEPAPAKPVEVLVHTVTVKEITDFEDFTGRLGAVDRVELQARVTGYLKKVHFKDGAEVKEGQLLFELD